MTKRLPLRKGDTAAARSAREDPMILGGHLGIIVTQSGLLTWQTARIDPASRRMVFEHSGGFTAPQMGGGWFTHCLLHAAEQAFDDDPYRPS